MTAGLLLLALLGPGFAAERGDGALPHHCLAEGREGVVVGLSGRQAVHAGLEILQQGGSATDAALATAMVQVVEAGGSFVSFAGILSMTAYDATTGQVSFLNAGYNTPLAETNPLSIPRFDPATLRGTASGRTALVPGFLAGVEAAHQRFGVLPFARVVAPAIALAEEGFPIDPLFAGFLTLRREVLGRLPATRRVFTRPDGSPYGLGDRFRQPELAATLRRVAADGPAFLTTGDWGRQFVAAVRQDGGVLTVRDLEAYRPTWESPLETTYGATQVFAPGFSATGGGVDAIEALNLLEQAGLERLVPPTQAAERLFWLAQITDNQGFATAPELAARRFPGQDFTPRARATKAHARWVWERMREGKWPYAPAPARVQGRPGHSSGVVAVDRRGNVAALTHTSNAAIWGNTGLFVGGISIPDSGSFQQEAIRQAGPGRRLPDPMCPLIATRAGKPILASSAIGGGLHQRNIQVYANILAFEMDAQAAVDAPAFLLPAWTGDRSVVQVSAGSFDAALLDGLAALGQPCRVVPPAEQAMLAGYWIGIQLDPISGRRRAAGTAEVPSFAEGY